MPYDDKAPYAMEKAGENRYRVKTRNGYIGSVTQIDDAWVVKIQGRTHGAYDTFENAVLALYLQYSMSQLD
jgi:hypothetical protein